MGYVDAEHVEEGGQRDVRAMCIGIPRLVLIADTQSPHVIGVYVCRGLTHDVLEC
jgi:hypothetical protein